MTRIACIRRLTAGILVTAIAIQAISCGTILHPERRGQPAGRIDPAIVLLDGLGLIFFFVPGVIAFAVDFSNGTIYLPPEECRHASDATAEKDGFATLQIDPERMTREALEAAIQRATGRSIALEPGAYDAEPIENLDKFGAAKTELADRVRSQPPREVILRAQNR